MDPDVTYPEKVKRRPDPDVRYLEKVASAGSGCEIPGKGGAIRTDFLPGGSRISGMVRKGGIKMLPLQNLACDASSLLELVRRAWDLQAMPSFVNRL